jgi:peptide/nickel transport system ATP-binding protein
MPVGAHGGRPRPPAQRPGPACRCDRTCGRFPIRGGLLDAGQTLAWWANRVAARRPPARPSCNCCARQATIDGQALLLDGKNLFELRGRALRAARRRDIQIIFQDPFASLNPRMRVYEMLDEGCWRCSPTWTPLAPRQRIEAPGRPGGPAPRGAGALSARVLGRPAPAHRHRPRAGGQPKLIVCDEPTSALDVSVQAQILNLLRDLQRELGVSYLFITHNIGVVEYIADQVAVMRAGRIVEQGPSAVGLERSGLLGRAAARPG